MESSNESKRETTETNPRQHEHSLPFGDDNNEANIATVVNDDYTEPNGSFLVPAQHCENFRSDSKKGTRSSSSSSRNDECGETAVLDAVNHQHQGQQQQRPVDTGDDAQELDNNDESEEAYRLRVYGTQEKNDMDDARKESRRERSSIRRLSRQFSNAMLRRQSSIVESLPETPAGWAVLASTIASSVLGYEVQLQKSLTCPPLVYGQCNVAHNAVTDGRGSITCRDRGPLDDIYKRMTASSDSILRRDIHPSLFVGTRGFVSSTAGYLLGGPGAMDTHVRFRQVLTMARDGAQVALDWELPILNDANKSEALSDAQRQEQIRNGPIQQSVVLILHGMNNDSSFGYIKNMMRTCTSRGWVAVCLNFRGCGGIPMTTPRGYSASYTGDLRHVVQHICARLSPSPCPCQSGTATLSLPKVFLVGHSLSANIVCKYLGEEGLSDTLPKQVAGAVSLSNPMFLGAVDPISSVVLALGVKRTVIESWSSIRKVNDGHYRSRIRKALLAKSILDFDNAMAPIFVRNEPVYPFDFRIGYENGHEYYRDASSYQYVRHVGVPLLQLIASDDFLVYPTFKTKSYFSMANPNVMVVETRCGGHLGWHESPPDNKGKDGSGRRLLSTSASWSDAATADFIQAVLESLREEESQRCSLSSVSLPKKDNHVIGVGGTNEHCLPSAYALNSSVSPGVDDIIERPPPPSPVRLQSRL